MLGLIGFLKAERVNPERQNKNKLSAVCLKFFLSILLTSNHMIFLVQFGMNKHLQIFQRPQIALAPRASAILLVFVYSCLFIPNCTRNHVIGFANTNCHALHQIAKSNANYEYRLYCSCRIIFGMFLGKKVELKLPILPGL